MRTLLSFVSGWYLGGVTVLASYYAVWLAVNPECHIHGFIVQMFLLWPWYRAVEVLAYCF